jgi:hypothetical protein
MKFFIFKVDKILTDTAEIRSVAGKGSQARVTSSQAR